LITRRWQRLLPAAIRRAGLPALGDMPPGVSAATARAIAEVSAGAANAGVWPGDQGSAEVLGEVLGRTRTAMGVTEWADARDRQRDRSRA
jgi:hypothetical protein